MGDPLNMYNGNGSRKRERKDDEEYEEYDEFDESNDGYIKVKINVSSKNFKIPKMCSTIYAIF